MMMENLKMNVLDVVHCSGITSVLVEAGKQKHQFSLCAVLEGK